MRQEIALARIELEDARLVPSYYISLNPACTSGRSLTAYSRSRLR